MKRYITSVTSESNSQGTRLFVRGDLSKLDDILQRITHDIIWQVDDTTCQIIVPTASTYTKVLHDASFLVSTRNFDDINRDNYLHYIVDHIADSFDAHSVEFVNESKFPKWLKTMILKIPVKEFVAGLCNSILLDGENIGDKYADRAINVILEHGVPQLKKISVEYEDHHYMYGREEHLIIIYDFGKDVVADNYSVSSPFQDGRLSDTELKKLIGYPTTSGRSVIYDIRNLV